MNADRPTGDAHAAPIVIQALGRAGAHDSDEISVWADENPVTFADAMGANEVTVHVVELRVWPDPWGKRRPRRDAVVLHVFEQRPVRTGEQFEQAA